MLRGLGDARIDTQLLLEGECDDAPVTGVIRPLRYALGKEMATDRSLVIFQ
jgi:hypothetical protein